MGYSAKMCYYVHHTPAQMLAVILVVPAECPDIGVAKKRTLCYSLHQFSKVLDNDSISMKSIGRPHVHSVHNWRGEVHSGSF